VKPDPVSPVALIVEDDGLLRLEIVSELQSGGWTVLEASTGEDAVAQLQSGQSIDLLITDIQLGGYLSGWEVADTFRSIDPRIPVIYASSNSTKKSRQVPNSIFFEKPYDTSKVLEACRRMLHSPQPASSVAEHNPDTSK
jgi:CheY-like chemotaxis protein